MSRKRPLPSWDSSEAVFGYLYAAYFLGLLVLLVAGPVVLASTGLPLGSALENTTTAVAIGYLAGLVPLLRR